MVVLTPIYISLLFNMLNSLSDSRIVFKERPVQHVAYSITREVWNGPRRNGGCRIEYDRGKFRETTLTVDNRPSTVRVYDRNKQHLNFMYNALSKHKIAGVDLESYEYYLALANPSKYRSTQHLPADAKEIGFTGPSCEELTRFDHVKNSNFKLTGTDTVANKTCKVYEGLVGSDPVRMKVWQGWILEELWHTHARLNRIISLKFVDKHPISTFKLPAGFTLSSPRFIRIQPMPGIKIKIVPDIHDK